MTSYMLQYYLKVRSLAYQFVYKGADSRGVCVCVCVRVWGVGGGLEFVSDW